jgi:type IV secretory pathway TrbD component
MLKAKHDGGPSDATEQGATAAAEPIDSGGDDRSAVIATAATVAVVGIGAAAFEAALLPGIVLGVAAMWLPQYLPKMGEALNPLFRSTVRGAYKLSKKTKEMMADAREQANDIVAEVHAEADQDRTSRKGAAAGGSPT